MYSMKFDIEKFLNQCSDEPLVLLLGEPDYETLYLEEQQKNEEVLEMVKYLIQKNLRKITSLRLQIYEVTEENEMFKIANLIHELTIELKTLAKIEKMVK